MKEKEKAVELVERFKPNVNPYVGSGMLSNTYDDGAILYQAKQCALICVDEILELRKQDIQNPDLELDEIQGIEFNINYWKIVKQEINKL